MSIGPSPGNLPRVLFLYCSIVITLTALALAIALFGPSSLLFPPHQDFVDLLCYQARFLNYGSAFFYAPNQGSVPWELPATMAPLYHLYLEQSSPVAAYLATVIVSATAMAGVFAVLLRKAHVSAATACAFSALGLVTAYPLWFLMECANLEFFVVLFVAAGMICYGRDKRWWSAACFGIAAALKLTPAIYLLLFLTKQGYRKLLFGVAVGVGVFVAAHQFTGPTLGLAFRGTWQALRDYHQHVVMTFRPTEIGFDHSLLGVVKQVCANVKGHLGISHINFQLVYRCYLGVAALIILCLYFAFIRELPALNKMIAITACALLFTPVSWDYRLTHLYVPWAWFVLYALRNPRKPELRNYLFCFAIIFTPQSFLLYRLQLEGVTYFVSYAGIIKAIALVALLLTALKRPLESKRRIELYVEPQAAREVDEMAEAAVLTYSM